MNSRTVSPVPKGTQLSSSVSTAIHDRLSKYSPEPDLAELNNSLVALAAVFPDVRPEVFREMLTSFTEESRLFVVAEQLLRHKAEWVKGRWRVPDREGRSLEKSLESGSEEMAVEEDGPRMEQARSVDQALVPLEEQFRSESYKEAARKTLYQEFKSLSKTTVDAVLAEKNYSYSMARPTLQTIWAKSWRYSLFNTFLSKWRKDVPDALSKHYMLLSSKSLSDPMERPILRETPDLELDLELRTTVLDPLLGKLQQDQEVADNSLAHQLNTAEAEAASATHECQCCFGDTTFETMATCTTGTHTICFACIRHGLNEALFGQSWGLNIDHVRGQIACLAPTSSTAHSCAGCIPHALAKRAITSSDRRGGTQTWQKFESRLTDEAILKAQIRVVQCPFCNYAELDELYFPRDSPSYSRSSSRSFLCPSIYDLSLDTTHPLLTLILILLALTFSLFYTLLTPRPLNTIRLALARHRRKAHLSPRFRCKSPACALPSCLNCRKLWIDPHKCYEAARVSLRTTIEAARTAALKRTCPQCGLGFVKDSGCNKLTCVCGFVMCYVCREGLGTKKRKPAPNQFNRQQDLHDPNAGFFRGGRAAIYDAVRERYREEEGPAEGEGYRHFCQHFRPQGGRCSECDKCDLYRGENEDEVVRRAGESAERAWKKKYEGEGRKDANAVIGAMSVGERERSSRWWLRQWTVQQIVDKWVELVIVC